MTDDQVNQPPSAGPTPQSTNDRSTQSEALNQPANNQEQAQTNNKAQEEIEKLLDSLEALVSKQAGRPNDQTQEPKASPPTSGPDHDNQIDPNPLDNQSYPYQPSPAPVPPGPTQPDQQTTNSNQSYSPNPPGSENLKPHQPDQSPGTSDNAAREDDITSESTPPTMTPQEPQPQPDQVSNPDNQPQSAAPTPPANQPPSRPASNSPQTPDTGDSKNRNTKLWLAGVAGFILLTAPLALAVKSYLFPAKQPSVYVQQLWEVGDHCGDDGYLGAGNCAVDQVNNIAVKRHFKCDMGQVKDYYEPDPSCCNQVNSNGLDNCNGGGEDTPTPTGGQNDTPTPGGGGETGDICCDGTPSCIAQKGEGWRCVRDSNTSCSGGSVCKNYGINYDPAYCNSDNDCAAWEVCQNNTCRSRAGCSQDSDCADNASCINGRCVGIKGTLECYADENGIRVINKTDRTLTGQVSWFGRWCNNTASPGFCAGTPSVENNITLKPGESFNRSMTNSKDPEAPRCDWQSDVEADFDGYSCDDSDHGRDPNCQASTPTPPPSGTACSQAVLTKVNGEPYTNQVIKPNDRLTFTGKGITDSNKTIDKIVFTVFKDGQKIKEAEGDGLSFDNIGDKKVYSAAYDFIVGAEGYGSYSVSVAVHSPDDGWACTTQ